VIAAAALSAAMAFTLTACGGNSGAGGNGGGAKASISGSQGASTARAAKYLKDAGVSTPVTLNIEYNPDHYGSSSDQEYQDIKEQLEATGLFKVNLQSAEWVTYNAQRVKDAYPIYQMGWFPDYPDPDNYLSVFFGPNNFVNNHFSDAGIDQEIVAEQTDTNPTTRKTKIEQLQNDLADKLSTLPLLQGKQEAVTGLDMTGVQDTLDASFQFRFAGMQKGGSASNEINIGTTDKVTALDPAGSYDNGSYLLEYNVYPFVEGFKPGTPTPAGDIATDCAFSTDGFQYTCHIKPGLKWANGDTLDANDVKFSYDRDIKINNPDGPSSLLENIKSITVPDNLTVVFNLKNANDVTFPQVLASPAGPIVDDQVFPADKLLSDDAIVKANAFAGPYTIDTYQVNNLVHFKANPSYQGLQGLAKNAGVTLKTYAEESNMKLDIENNAIDVAYRSLSPTDTASLQKNKKVKVLYGPGGEIRYLTFNMNTMPGNTPAQKLAVRQAIASSIDRDEISQSVYKGTYEPLCSYVPDGLLGANTAVCDKYNK
jgi:ABC-type transport system substrate-binding protein